jgi:hypothetical protein
VIGLHGISGRPVIGRSWLPPSRSLSASWIPLSVVPARGFRLQAEGHRPPGHRIVASALQRKIVKLYGIGGQPVIVFVAAAFWMGIGTRGFRRRFPPTRGFRVEAEVIGVRSFRVSGHRHWITRTVDSLVRPKDNGRRIHWRPRVQVLPAAIRIRGSALSG